MDWLTTIIGMLGQKYATVGTILGYIVLVGIPIMTVLIDVMDTIVKATASSKDDELAAKIDAIWAKVLPFLEVLPHMNLPISAGVMKVVNLVLKIINSVKAAIVAWFST